MFTESNRNLHGDADISDVVNAIVEGLTSASPSDRYMVGRDARYGLIPFEIFSSIFCRLCHQCIVQTTTTSLCHI